MEMLIQQKQVEQAFLTAEKIGWSFDGDWSLSKEALRFFSLNLLKLDTPLHILELGAGQSTLFWYSLIKDGDLNLVVTSFEHHPIWADYVQKRVGNSQFLKVEHLGLKVINEEEWLRIFEKPAEAAGIWNPLGTEVKEEKFEDCSLHNAFYQIPDELFSIMKPIDALILDGPHGNGRSLAFPLFFNLLKPNAVILIDDVDHYNFLGNLLSLFDFQILVKKIEGEERWAIVRLEKK